MVPACSGAPGQPKRSQQADGYTGTVIEVTMLGAERRSSLMRTPVKLEKLRRTRERIGKGSALFLRDEIQVVVTAGAGEDDCGKIGSDGIGVAAVVFPESEGKFERGNR